MHEILNFPFCYDKTLLFYAEIKICTILNFYDIKQQITYLKQIDPDLKIFSPNPFYTNESLSRTDFLRTVRYPGRYPSMQSKSKSIPDVHKFVLRPKIFSAGLLIKSYVKERSPPPSGWKVYLRKLYAISKDVCIFPLLLSKLRTVV